MKYISQKYIQDIQITPDVGFKYWRRAMSFGLESERCVNNREAQQYYGCAFEIVVLLMHEGLCQTKWVPLLTDAGRALTQTLFKLKQMDEAEDILKFIHRQLIAVVQDTKDDQKYHYFLGLQKEFHKKAVWSLKLAGKFSQAETLRIITQKLQHATIRQHCH